MLRDATGTTSQELRGENSGMSGGQDGFSSGSNTGMSSGTSRTTSWNEREVVDVQLMDALSNRIVRSVPVEEQVAEVVVRTVQGSRRVLDVCRVKTCDPPRS